MNFSMGCGRITYADSFLFNKPLLTWGLPGSSAVENRTIQEIQETWIWSFGLEDPLEEEMESHSSILAWRISWPEEPGGLQSMGSQKNQTWLKEWTARTADNSLEKFLPDVLLTHRVAKSRTGLMQLSLCPHTVYTAATYYLLWLSSRMAGI